MKNIIQGLLFWISIIVAIIVITAIGQAVAEIITMNLVMTVVYVALGISFIYLIRN